MDMRKNVYKHARAHTLIACTHHTTSMSQPSTGLISASYLHTHTAHVCIRAGVAILHCTQRETTQPPKVLGFTVHVTGWRVPKFGTCTVVHMHALERVACVRVALRLARGPRPACRAQRSRCLPSRTLCQAFSHMLGVPKKHNIFFQWVQNLGTYGTSRSRPMWFSLCP